MPWTVPLSRISAMCRHPRTVASMTIDAVLGAFCADPLPPYTELICLETASEAQAITAFTRLAESRSPEPCRLIDVAVRAPADARWKSADVTDLLRLLALAPQHRRVVLLLAADVLDPAAVDMLLKAVEEPAAPLTLVLATPQAAALPTTLRSRMLHTFTLPSPLPPGAAKRLAELALPAPLLDRVDVHDLLALLLSAPAEVSAPLAEVLYPGPTPVLDAAEFFSRFDALLSGLDLPADVRKRIRTRAPRLPMAVFESLCYEDPARFLTDDSLAAYRQLRSALELTLAPLPHLSAFYSRLAPL